MPNAPGQPPPVAIAVPAGQEGMAGMEAGQQMPVAYGNPVPGGGGGGQRAEAFTVSQQVHTHAQHARTHPAARSTSHVPPPKQRPLRSTPPPIRVSACVAQSIPSIEVAIPPNHGPGSTFRFRVGSLEHSITVPEGAHAGQKLTCMVVPPGVFPGQEVVVLTPQGEMAVDIPAGMGPGEVLIVDVGTDLRQWVDSPSCMERVQEFFACLAPHAGALLCFGAICILALVLFSGHRRTYGYGGYGGGYQHPDSAAYIQHRINNAHNVQGAVAAPAAPVDPNAYPGKDEGFERGVDEKGNEIYR